MSHNYLGWHLGNEAAMDSRDWTILRSCPPSLVVYLPGQKVTVNDVRAILAINPLCHVLVRPYFDPRRLGDLAAPAYATVMPTYVAECLAAVKALVDVVPTGQLHLQMWNEQNMPRWALNDGWGEGFGDQLADMRAFNQWFCYGYQKVKAVYPTVLIGWTPLTAGNRDVWFPGDAVGHYYLHGPEGCAENLTPTQIQAAIASGPCRESLSMADEFYCHVYYHEHETDWQAAWQGRRFERYAQFLPKPMRILIPESGIPSASWWRDWTGRAMVRWHEYLWDNWPAALPALWMLGTHWGGMWYGGGGAGGVRPEVYQLAEAARSYVATPPAAEESDGGETVTLEIDGRLMSAAEFDEYVAGIDTGVERVVIHHTFAPDAATWQKYGGWAYWGERMRQIYQDTRGWTKGPHLFASEEGIGLFYDLTQDGRAVGGGSLEKGCRHIETVGDYTKVVPSGATLDNVVAAAAALLYHAGLGIEALTYHRAVVDGGSECPGAAWIAAWGWFKSLVEAKLGSMTVNPYQLSPELLAEAEKHVIAQVPGHALYDYIEDHGWTHDSDEFALGDWPAVQGAFDAAKGLRYWFGWSPATGVVKIGEVVN